MKRPRVLVFASLFPLPIDRGDKNRLYHSLQLMKQHADVTLVHLNRSWEARPADETLHGIETIPCTVSKGEVLVQCGRAAVTGRPHTLFRFASPRILDFVHDVISRVNPDLLWVYHLSSFPILEREHRLPIVLDLVDSPSLHQLLSRSAPHLSLPARLANRCQWRLGHFEDSAIKASACVLISSLPDREHLVRSHGMGNRLVLFSNSVPESLLGSERRPPTPGAPPCILFVGNLAYPPNADGVRFFVRQVFPLIRQKLPSARFVVCGARNGRLVSELGSEQGVCFTGFVSDLSGLYAESHVMVVPVPLATGSQYKVLEAMAVGLPVVSSPASAQACGLTHGREVLIASTPEDYASAVTAIIARPGLSEALMRHARAMISAQYTWESKAALMQTILEDSIARKETPCAD
jgi:glycosyltransferase involved in cell wall biosynthesis